MCRKSTVEAAPAGEQVVGKLRGNAKLPQHIAGGPPPSMPTLRFGRFDEIPPEDQGHVACVPARMWPRRHRSDPGRPGALAPMRIGELARRSRLATTALLQLERDLVRVAERGTGLDPADCDAAGICKIIASGVPDTGPCGNW